MSAREGVEAAAAARPARTVQGLVPAQRRPGAALRPRAGRLVLVLAAAVLPRLVGLGAPARPDEAGYLAVARYAQRGGPELYGTLWVDRPPLLVGFFRLADDLGGLVAARLLALLGVVVLVLSAAAVGRTVSGERGARWAAVVTAALTTTPLLGAPGIDGELLGVPLVLLACAVGLRALARPWAATPVPGLVSGGCLGAGALLVKQNLVGALVLLAGTLLAQQRSGGLPAGRALRLGVALTGGACLPLLALLAWARVWGTGPGALWTTLVAFRDEALDVVATGDGGPPGRRAAVLVLVLLVSGAAPLLALALARRALPPVGVGLAAATGTSALSIALGGSYWLHYLVELVPLAAVAAALLALRARPVDRRAVGLVVVSSAVATAVGTPLVLAGGCRTPEAGAAAAAAVVRARALPGDTGLTLYGGSNALHDTGVRPAYPYLWSLPVRTLDPDLARLRDALDGPDGAAWAVRTLGLGAYGLDADGRVRELLRERYRPVARVCGTDVLLRADLSRPARP